MLLFREIRLREFSNLLQRNDYSEGKVFDIVQQ